MRDATRSARRLLDSAEGETLDWTDVRNALAPIFGPLPDRPPTRRATLSASGDRDIQMRMQPDGPALRLEVETRRICPGEWLRMRADRAEFDRLKLAMAHAPCPIWQTDEAGRVVWRNPAYDDICQQLGTAAEDAASPFEIIPADGNEPQVARVSLGDRDAPQRMWFEVHSHRVPGGLMHFALDIDAVVDSENSQRNFLQTLTRIFAHLPIGLAIFDKDLRLVLFNPALVDLTQLTAEFLSGRPNLLSFFDMMREQRQMPEPKNYANWREKLSELIAAASSDLYTETWNLPSGLTYRVTGRPHPDGGIAFLFEDISAEIALTRHFRQEIEVTQAVLDCIDDAVALFSQTGVLTFCNEAYREMWESDPESAVTDITIAEASLEWKAACKPSPIWPDLREFVLTLRDRASWDATLETHGGETVICRIEPITGGATLVRFSRQPGLPVPVTEVRHARI
ncbi:sensor [Salipiger mucosus DSM 16094]|uniref:Sensor n=1 Tax=Salipiger mucosus DSM 16094 TaxID=1123237 RepID=S9S8B3_9RHOB|nr:sensor [Salipiger mucosus DSM 16094]